MFGDNYLNEWKGDLMLANYQHLEKIVVKKNSLNNLNSLKICNCEKLKSIEVKSGSTKHVTNVNIESIAFYYF